MLHRLHTPAAPLSLFIENLWFYEGYAPGHAREKLLPDAAMELIIDLTDTPKKLHDNARPERYTEFRKSWISGMQQGYLVIGVEQDSSMMGARFRTGGAYPFFGLPLVELASQVIELDQIWKRDILALRERLLEAATVDAKFQLLEAFLLERARRALATDPAVDFTMARMRTCGACSVRELAERVGLSQKTLITRFHKRVGLPPKMLGRVFRFQRALQAMTQPATRDLAQLALDAGYYDQAHFNHEFREFSGLTPTEYLASTSLYPNWVATD